MEIEIDVSSWKTLWTKIEDAFWKLKFARIENLKKITSEENCFEETYFRKLKVKYAKAALKVARNAWLENNK